MLVGALLLHANTVERSSTAVAETIESRRTKTYFFSEAAEKELLSKRHLIYNNDRIGIFENQGCPDVLIDEFDEEELAIRRRAAAEPVASGQWPSRLLQGKQPRQGRDCTLGSVARVPQDAGRLHHKDEEPNLSNVAVAVGDQKLPYVECLEAFR